MFEAYLDPHRITGLLLVAIPLTYGVAAAVPAGSAKDRIPAVWRRAALAATGALTLALLVAAALFASGSQVFRRLHPAPVEEIVVFSPSLRLDVLTAVMLVLVTFIGVVILHYSRRYLDGDDGQTRYVRWFLATLSAVSLLVMANNLLLMWLAWLGMSLAVHQLLTFYDERPQALIAAHKKFITSRAADACLLVALALIAQAYGSVELDEIFARLEHARGSSISLQIAAVLLVAAASLKCAQLPFHGWLIQVMEAPTPVSALLHAGVVNIGGFLMIRLAPLMVQAELAQTLLVFTGSVTAVVASLVMMTRVSIKVALAWSTVAQMGFMLLECGLGAYSIALLHLVAHSLYKANAFLMSGSTVEVWRAQALAAPAKAVSLAAWMTGAAVSLAIFGGVALLLVQDAARKPELWTLMGILALAQTPLLARSAASDARDRAMLVGGSIAISVSYLVWHALFDRLLAVPDVAGELAPFRIAIVGVAFLLLFVISAAMDAHPTGCVARALYPRLFAGLFLDEIFTRLTFRIWPARLPSAPAPPRTLGLRPAAKEIGS